MYFSLSVRARVLVYGLECVLMCMSDVSLSVSLAFVFLIIGSVLTLFHAP